MAPILDKDTTPEQLVALLERAWEHACELDFRKFAVYSDDAGWRLSWGSSVPEEEVKRIYPFPSLAECLVYNLRGEATDLPAPSRKRRRADPYESTLFITRRR